MTDPNKPQAFPNEHLFIGVVWVFREPVLGQHKNGVTGDHVTQH